MGFLFNITFLIEHISPPQRKSRKWQWNWFQEVDCIRKLDLGLGPTAYLNSASWHHLNVLNGELAKIPMAVVPFHSPSVNLKETKETVPVRS